MALTSSSQFVRVVVGFDYTVHILGWVHFTTTDGDIGTIYLTKGYPEAGTDDRTDLEILQTIYASSDGFQDENGDSLTVTIGTGAKPAFISSIDDFEANGIPNPFIAGSWERWLTLPRFGGTFTEDGAEVEKHSTTETRTIQLPANVEPAERTPASPNYGFPLENIRVVQETETRISFEIFIDASDNVTENGLDALSILIAFRAWLQANLSTGSDYGTDFSASGSFTSRESTIDQDNGNGDVVFEPASLAYGLSNSNVTSWKLGCDRVSGAALDATAMYALMLETDVSIPTTEGIEKPYIGHKDHKVIGKEFDFGNKRRIIMESNLLVLRTRDADDKLFEVPLGSHYGRELSYAKMPVNLSSIKTIPEIGYYDTFHFGRVETANGLIVIPSPPNLVIQEDTRVTYAFHNISDDYNLEIQDWEEENLITLHPGEYAKFQVALHGEGGGGEIRAVDVQDRVMLHVGNQVGDIQTAWWRNTFNSAQYYREIRHTDNGEQIHEDTFLKSTESIRDVVAQGTWQSETDWDVNNSFVLLKKADLTISWEITLEITADNSGGFSNGNDLRVYRQPGGSGIAEQLATAPREDWSGRYEQRIYHILQTNRYDAGDRFFALFKYNTTSNISASNCEIQHYRRRVTAKPIIQKEWIP